MITACAVELIRYAHRAEGPHEVKVRICGLPDGAETLTRKLSTLRRARQVAWTLAKHLKCEVIKIDMRSSD